MDFRIGLMLPTDRPDDLIEAVRTAERLGFESVWIPDLTSGDGPAPMDCVVAASVAVAVSTTVKVGFAVAVAPVRPVLEFAAQIAALQRISGGRMLVGLGAGGFPGTPYWDAFGATMENRGRRLEEMLAVLPDLVAGRPTPIGELGPGAEVPRLLVGGNSKAAIRRAATGRHDWFPSLMTPEQLRAGIADLRAAGGSGEVTIGGHTIIGPDVAADRARFVQLVVDTYGYDRQDAEQVPVTGSVEEVATILRAHRDAGATRAVLNLDRDDWDAQAELLRQAWATV